MKCYVVTFEAESQKAREAVKEKLKTYGSYCPIHEHCWAVLTEKSSVNIRDDLRSLIEEEAPRRVFVVRSGTEAAWFNNYGEAYDKWLKDNL